MKKADTLYLSFSDCEGLASLSHSLVLDSNVQTFQIFITWLIFMKFVANCSATCRKLSAYLKVCKPIPLNMENLRISKCSSLLSYDS